jgi:hypothetical protein
MYYNPRNFLNYGRHGFSIHISLGMEQIHIDIAQVYIRIHRSKEITNFEIYMD